MVNALNENNFVSSTPESDHPLSPSSESAKVVPLVEIKKFRSRIKQVKPKSTSSDEQNGATPNQDLLRTYMNDASRYSLLSVEARTELEQIILRGRNAQSLLDLDPQPEHPLFDKKQINALREIVKEGETAKRHYTTANLGLVVLFAKRYQNYGLDLIDLIQEGNFGLMKAVDKFDPGLGFRFSTYASWWIKQSMRRAIAEKSRTIRFSVRTHDIIRQSEVWRKLLRHSLQREPELEEIADKIGMDSQRLRDLLPLSKPTISLQAPLHSNSTSQNSDGTVEDFISDQKLLSEDERIDALSIGPFVHKLIRLLKPRERKIIEAHFGLKGKPLTLEEIGQCMVPIKNTNKNTITRERVRQIEKITLKKLREICEDLNLHPLT